MSDLILILVGTVLVNNFVLVRFLGLCPIMGVSRNVEPIPRHVLAVAWRLKQAVDQPSVGAGAFVV